MGYPKRLRDLPLFPHREQENEFEYLRMLSERAPPA
jgi:hypothetical protein